jgi:hypothetical protein
MSTAATATFAVMPDDRSISQRDAIATAPSPAIAAISNITNARMFFMTNPPDA